MSVDSPKHFPCLVELRNLTRLSTTQERLLSCPSFKLWGGDFVRVVGPTGAGKSLLLRSLVQLDPVESGEIFEQGHAVLDHDVPEFRQRVQYLSQRSPSLGRTVEEDISKPLQLTVNRSKPGNRDRLDEWLRRFDLSSNFLTRRTRDLSGGERQLVALLRSLITDPTVLLMDEPTSALDPESTRRVESMVLDWLNEGQEHRAVMWVSHDQDQVSRLPGRLINIKAGLISEAVF